MRLKPHPNELMPSIRSVKNKNREKCHEIGKKLWHDTLNAINEAVLVMDANHLIQQCNQAMVQMIGQSESEIIGQYCWQLIHGTESPVENCPCSHLTQHNRPKTVSLELKDRSFEVSVAPRFNERGRIYGYIHIFSDITKRKQSEIALAETRNALTTILDSIDATIFVASMDTHEILFMNRYMKDTFGGDLTGQKCWRALRKKQGPCINCANSELLDSQGKPKGTFVREGRNEITGRWYVNYNRAIKWINGQYVHLQVATDITEIKAMQQERHNTEIQLRQAQKMEAIGTLAGGIAHDFNNILSAILGYSELALDDALHDRTSVDYIREIRKAANRARDLVHQILTFSRQAETESKPIQVQPIVKEALKLLRASLPSTIDIQVDIQSKAIVEADPIQIHQVIMNLCTNAGHAMRPSGGTLTVQLVDVYLDSDFTDKYPDMAAGEYLQISVSDSGPGIPLEIRDKIFDPYFTTKEKGEGTGMGLAVVQGIVHNCKGTLAVHSAPGAGACFQVYLPVIHISQSCPAKAHVTIPGGQERILFVDDEPPLADLSKQMLERMGYQVTIRTSSIEALALFESNPQAFDLVITDMTMPHMTGDILTSRLLAIRPEIPVIVCTGYSEKMTQDILKQLKIRALIMKPIIRDELLLSVRQILNDAKKV